MSNDYHQTSYAGRVDGSGDSSGYGLTINQGNNSGGTVHTVIGSYLYCHGRTWSGDKPYLSLEDYDKDKLTLLELIAYLKD